MLDVGLQRVSPHDLGGAETPYLGLEFSEDNALGSVRQHEIGEACTVSAVDTCSDLVTLWVEHLPAVSQRNLFHDALPDGF